MLTPMLLFQGLQADEDRVLQVWTLLEYDKEKKSEDNEDQALRVLLRSGMKRSWYLPGVNGCGQALARTRRRIHGSREMSHEDRKVQPRSTQKDLLYKDSKIEETSKEFNLEERWKESQFTMQDFMEA